MRIVASKRHFANTGVIHNEPDRALGRARAVAFGGGGSR